MPKKENNKKNYTARERWMKSKKEGRPKQRFVDLRGTSQNPADAWWEKVPK